MNILVTGGCGYIGSHTVLVLLQAGHSVVVVDNLNNSNKESLRRVSELCGKTPDFHQLDVCDIDAMRSLFRSYSDKGMPLESAIHFAGLKAVGESTAKPLAYYRNNIDSTLSLLEVMSEFDCKRIVFSSSATVYGSFAKVPYTEDMPTGTGITNPYGWTKSMIEQILRDLHTADSAWSIALLRYFNPVGAHPSGRIGEDPRGIPNNLLPYISQVAVGRRAALSVFGNDYPTPDGTGVRDYIHVMDLAEGHLAALNALASKGGLHTWNLGTGHGISVLEMLHAFEAACGKKLPYIIAPRRAGDLAECWADTSLSERELGWKASRSLDDMVRDAWTWQKNNPNGYNAE